MSGQEFRTPPKQQQQNDFAVKELSFAPLTLNYIWFVQDWICLQRFQTQPVALHHSCHSSSQLYHQHGSSHHSANTLWQLVIKITVCI